MYEKSQKLNDWVEMLHQIYGRSQNYSKTEYEIHSHITEVSGAFGKYLFKKRQPERAVEFLPKMFSWAVALLKKVKGNEANLEDILLTKYPRACPYCVVSPCTCWKSEKPELNAERVRNEYHRAAAMQGRSINDIQLMFRQIYEQSWGVAKPDIPIEERYAGLMKQYSRLIEELSETAEAMRLHHLYPSNFNNELADYFAWWFALASSLHVVDSRAMHLAEELLWTAYPGYCSACTLRPCDCRPGPVRELLSKPALTDMNRIDGLTQAHNQGAFEDDIRVATAGTLAMAAPITCIRIDVDNFKSVNETFDHAAGDAALTHIVTVTRQKIRTRDRLYRAGGDEFAILCSDLSSEEAAGMMRRVQQVLKDRPVIVRTRGGEKKELRITLSIGICSAPSHAEVSNAFKRADHAAIQSKHEGKDRVTIVPLVPVATDA